MYYRLYLVLLTATLVLTGGDYPLSAQIKPSVESDFVRGKSLFVKGRYERASVFFHQVLKENPQHVGARYHLALCLAPPLQVSRWTRRYMEEVCFNNTSFSSSKIYLQRSRYRKWKGDENGARLDLVRFLQARGVGVSTKGLSNPTTVKKLEVLKALLQLKKLSQPGKIKVVKPQTNPNNVHKLMKGYGFSDQSFLRQFYGGLGIDRKALESLEKSLDHLKHLGNRPSLPREFYLHRGRIYLLFRDRKKAEADLARAVPWSGQARAYLAFIYHLRQKTKVVQKYLASSITGKSKPFEGYWLMAMLQEKARDMEGAEMFYTMALALDSQWGRGYFRRGTVRFLLGRDKEAHRDFKRAFGSMKESESRRELKKFLAKTHTRSGGK